MKKSVVAKFVSGLIIAFLANKALGFVGVVLAAASIAALTYNFKEGE